MEQVGSVNATSLKANFVGNFVRARTCVKQTWMKSNQKYKMFVSESSIFPQNFMSIGVRLDTKKNRSECTALMLDEK
jgi:hypothetical protein